MRILFIFLFLGLTSGFSADIRSDFHDGMFSEEELLRISESEAYANSALTIAYKGVCYTMLADYQFFPTSKLSYFNDGKYYLEKAIKTNPNQLEMRYLRLLVQLNCPSFLGYSDQIDADLVFFHKNITNFKIDIKWKLKFITNLIAGEKLTTSQKNKLIALKKEYA